MDIMKPHRRSTLPFRRRQRRWQHTRLGRRPRRKARCRLPPRCQLKTKPRSYGLPLHPLTRTLSHRRRLTMRRSNRSKRLRRQNPMRRPSLHRWRQTLHPPGSGAFEAWQAPRSLPVRSRPQRLPFLSSQHRSLSRYQHLSSKTQEVRAHRSESLPPELTLHLPLNALP